MKRIVSGVQPSGRLHLGNYLGSVSRFAQLAQQADEVFFFIADLHAITTEFKPLEMRKNRFDLATTYLACGLDQANIALFMQSAILEHTALGHILLCHTAIGELERMTQFKDKAANTRQVNGTHKIPTGLLTYPVLMAADVLLYQANAVPVGADQKQHLELARDLAIRFNKKYGETFVVPEPLISKEAGRIMDLQDPTKKMSKSAKSHKGVIFLDEDIETIKTKIMAAKTDSKPEITYGEADRFSVNNLLNIFASVLNDRMNDDFRKELFGAPVAISEAIIATKYHNLGFRALKTDLARAIINIVQNINDKKQHYINSNKINDILRAGAKKAEIVAKNTMELVYEKIGF